MSYEGMGANELGVAAYNAGHKLATNPFRDDTSEAKQFALGWKFADKQAKRIARLGTAYAKSARAQRG